MLNYDKCLTNQWVSFKRNGSSFYNETFYYVNMNSFPFFYVDEAFYYVSCVSAKFLSQFYSKKTLCFQTISE